MFEVSYEGWLWFVLLRHPLDLLELLDLLDLLNLLDLLDLLDLHSLDVVIVRVALCPLSLSRPWTSLHSRH